MISKKILEKIKTDRFFPAYEKEKKNSIAKAFGLDLSDEEFCKKLQDPVFFAEEILKVKPWEKQKELLRANSKRIIAVWGRASGKSWCTALKAVHWIFTKPNQVVLIISPWQRQSSDMFKIIKDFIYSNKILKASLRRHTETCIELNNNSIVHSLPTGTTGAAIRGKHADLIILEEASYIKDEIVNRVIMQELIAKSGTLIKIGTPWIKNHFYYSFVKDPDYFKSHCTSYDAPHTDKKAIDREKEKLNALDFRREYLAEFVDSAYLIFPPELIEPCIAEEDYPSINAGVGEFYCGCDFGKLQDKSCIIVVEKTKEGKLKLVHWKSFRGQNYSKVIRHLEFLHSSFNRIIKFVVDKTSVGERPCEELIAAGLPIQGIMFSSQSKTNIIGNLRLQFENQNLILPKHRPMLGEISSYEYKELESGRVKFSAPKKRHDDWVIALALAVWGIKTNIKQCWHIVSR